VARPKCASQLCAFSPRLRSGVVVESKHSFCLPIYSKLGQKTERAEEWGIPIVNHLWVEECFKRWAFVHPAAEGGRFVSYPSGVNYAEILGQRGIGNVRREELDLESEGADPEQPKKDARTGNAGDMHIGRSMASTSKAASPKKILVPGPPASNTSSAAEVEESTYFDKLTLFGS
jgi:hypothetical protein